MMTLQDALAEVKRLWAISPPSPDETNWAAIVFNAVASGDLIPKADAELAVALAYQRAADQVRCGCNAITGCMDIANCAQEDVDAILALAPADALAEVERLKTIQGAADVLCKEATAAAYLRENVTPDEAAMLAFMDALGKHKVLVALAALKGDTP